MKNIFTTFIMFLVLSGLGITINAQVLASFEDIAKDSIRLSDYATSGDPYWYDNARFVEGGTPQVGNNPAKGGINTSDKCLLAVNVADADWWGNFCVLGLSTPVLITEDNRYLHLKVYRSIQPKNFRLGFNDREEANEVFQGKVANDGQWEAVVCDLGAKFMGQSLQYLHIIFSTNWSDPRTGWDAATYAFDDIALSNSPIPPSITLVDGNGLSVSFQNQTETDQWIKTIDLIHTSNTGGVVDNPFTSSTVNSAGKVYQFNKSADASWWQGARFDFNGLMEVGGSYPNFLHVLVYVPSSALQQGDMGIDVQLSARNHMGNENNELFTVWDDEVDEWKDLVMEINQIQYLKEFTARFDLRKEGENYINSPANTYYVDEIVFDKSSEPRTVITGLPGKKADTFTHVYTNNGSIIVNVKENSAIRVYNLMGRAVKTVNAKGRTDIPVEKGIYIVKVTTSNDKTKIAKIVVQ